MDKNLLYRSIPKVDVLLEQEEMKTGIEKYGRDIVVDAIRIETEALRKFIGTCESEEAAKDGVANVTASILARAEKMLMPNMKKVINATGTILHTNLGRAPIGMGHMQHIAEIATGYSNLEYNYTFF